MLDSRKELPARIERFRSLHQESPSARYFAPLADLLRQAGRHEEALELLTAGLAEHEGYLAGLVIQGRTLFEVGRGEEARAVWQQVLAIDADNLLALEFLADDALQRKEWGTAEPLLERLCRLTDPDSRWSDALQEARGKRTRPVPPPAAISAKAPAEAPVEPPENRPRQSSDQKPGVNKGTSFDTMTLVDIYLAQGYRDRALAVLRRMLPGAGDSRDEILGRIRVLEEVEEGTEPSGATEAETVPAGDSAAGEGLARVRRDLRERTGGDRFPTTQPEREARERERTRLREAERRQFEEWLEKIRFNGGHGA